MDELDEQIAALTELLAEFKRARRLDAVPDLVAEHRACYLWDRKLRVHARILPPHAPRELRKKLDYHLAQNTRHLNAIEEACGPDGIRAIFRTPDVRYRLRVMDEAVRLFPLEAERVFEEVLLTLRDDPRYGYPPDLLERALEQLRANRLAPALPPTDDHSLSPTLGRRPRL